MVYGSHLYGLNTPDSDTDIKGIFLPDIKDCILRKVPRSIVTSTGLKNDKNTNADEDYENFSLQGFVELAIKGEMIVIDMLHAPDNMLLETSPEWEFVRENRAKFYSKKMRGYFGYILSQVNKYSVRGERLKTAGIVMEFLDFHMNKGNRMSDVWHLLPKLPFTDQYEIPEANQEDKRVYEVCGKKIPATVSLEYALKEMIEPLVDSYGERARKAKNNDGIDYKAFSHAFRAVEQMLEIVETGDLKYPLKNAQFILDIKQGKLDMQRDNLSEILSAQLESLEEKLKASDLPEKVDAKFWQEFVCDCYTK